MPKHKVSLVAVQFSLNKNHIQANEFIKSLRGRFSKNAVDIAVDDYLLGTWPDGRTAFWYEQRDGTIVAGRLARGSFMNPETKDGGDPQWVNGNVLPGHRGGYDSSRVTESFFGESLLNAYPGLPVFVVPNERTAMIASLVLGNGVWLANGPSQPLMVERLIRIAHGRRISLFPSTRLFHEWKQLVDSDPRYYKKLRVSETLQTKNSGDEEICDLDIGDVILAGTTRDMTSISPE